MKKLVSIISIIAVFIACFAGMTITAAADENMAVTPIVSDSPNYQQVVLSGCDANTVYYLFANGSQIKTAEATNGTMILSDPNTDYQIMLLDKATGKKTSLVRSIRAHSYNVSYTLYAGGGVVASYTQSNGAVYYGGNFEYTADSVVWYDGRQYQLSDVATTQVIKYGKASYNFNFELYSPADLDATVDFVDAKGNKLGGESVKVSYYGGDVVVNAPASIEKNGKTYNRDPQAPAAVTFNYYSPVLRSTIKYVEEAIEETTPVEPYKPDYVWVDGEPYNWNFYMVDAVSGAQLESKTVVVTPSSVATFTPAFSLEVGGKTYYIDASQNHMFERNYDSKASTSVYLYYTEAGVVVDAEKNLKIVFKCVSNNTVLETIDVTILAGETATIDCPATYAKGGKNYIRLSGQGDVLTIPYTTERAGYYVYYRDPSDVQNADIANVNGGGGNGGQGQGGQGQAEGGNVLENEENFGDFNDFNNENQNAEAETTVVEPSTEEITESTAPLNGPEASSEEVITDPTAPLAGGKNGKIWWPYAVAGAVVAGIIVILATRKKKEEE